MTCLGLGRGRELARVAGKIRLADSYLPKLVRVQKADMPNEPGVSQT